MTRSSTAPRTDKRWLSWFSALTGLAGLVVLLQGLWAGIFVKEHQDYPHTWIVVHSVGAKVAFALAVLAAVLAFWKLRPRRDLWIGGTAFALLILLESYVGGLIGQHQSLTALHFPLAMALVGLAVWLPIRAGRHSQAGGELANSSTSSLS